MKVISLAVLVASAAAINVVDSLAAKSSAAA